MKHPKAKTPTLGPDFLISANKVTRSEVRAIRALEKARRNVASMLRKCVANASDADDILRELDFAHLAQCEEFNLDREEQT